MIAVMIAGCSKGGPSASAAGGAKAWKVALVINQRFGDNGAMDDLASGADRAAKDFPGLTIKRLESESSAKFEDDIRAMSRDYDLVVTTFPYMTEATKLVSKEFPNKFYAAVFQFVNVGGERYNNIWDTEYHGEQAFYICGYMAGLITKTNKVGMIIGAEEPTPNAEGNAYMRGVKAANPNASVEFSFVGSYEDPAKAKEISSAMIAKGCDFLQTDAGASNAGVIEAAKEKNILCAGEITDFWDSYRNFVGIVGIGFGSTAYKAIETLVAGAYPGGEHGIQDLSNGGYFMDWPSYERYVQSNSSFAGIVAKGKEVENQIKSGALKVAFDTEVPNWARIAAE
jgi:basic membrane protein A